MKHSHSFAVNCYSEPPAPCYTTPRSWLPDDREDLNMNLNNGGVFGFTTSTPIAVQVGKRTSMIIEPSYMRNLFDTDCILETRLELEEMASEGSEAASIEEGVEVSGGREVPMQRTRTQPQLVIAKHSVRLMFAPR